MGRFAWLLRLQKWLAGQVADAPAEVAYCEFNCARAHCMMGDWDQCRNREKYAHWERSIATEAPPVHRGQPACSQAPVFMPAQKASPERRARASAPPEEGARSHSNDNGRIQALALERHLLMRQIEHRFDHIVAEAAEPLLNDVRDQESMEIVGEWVVQCGEAREFLVQLDKLVSR